MSLNLEIPATDYLADASNLVLGEVLPITSTHQLLLGFPPAVPRFLEPLLDGQILASEVRKLGEVVLMDQNCLAC